MTEKRSYAEGTSVSVEKSQGEISQILRRFGAEEFGHKESRGKGYFMFVIGGIAYQMEVPLPPLADFTTSPAGRSRTDLQAQTDQAAEIRRRWRSLLLNIKAKIVAIDDGISTVEKEFLAFVMLPSGMSIGDAMIPTLQKIAASGEFPKMLGSR